MRIVPVIAVLFPWMLFEPSFHSMRPEKAVIGVLVAFLALLFAVMSLGDRRLRAGVAATGVILGLSNFYFPDNLSVMVSHTVAAAVLLIVGLPPRSVSTFSEARAPVSSAAQALLHEPQPGSA